MKYVIANLKMNLVTVKDCDQYLDTLNQVWLARPLAQKTDKQNDTVQIIVCPSSLYIERFAGKLPQSVLLGAQDVFWEERGSFTGAISPLSLRAIGVSAIICGHSERRAVFGETDEQIARKVETVVKNKMTAIICVGETQEERNNEESTMIVAQQVASALSLVEGKYLDRIVIAYEPRWAIGTDTTPATQDIMQMRIVIQKILIKKYGVELTQKVSIVYGGSVTASLMDEVCVSADMNGVLVGRESLDPKELMNIIEKL
jgi:triosephosphate isomerase